MAYKARYKVLRLDFVPVTSWHLKSDFHTSSKSWQSASCDGDRKFELLEQVAPLGDVTVYVGVVASSAVVLNITWDPLELSSDIWGSVILSQPLQRHQLLWHFYCWNNLTTLLRPLIFVRFTFDRCFQRNCTISLLFRSITVSGHVSDSRPTNFFTNENWNEMEHCHIKSSEIECYPITGTLLVTVTMCLWGYFITSK